MRKKNLVKNINPLFAQPHTYESSLLFRSAHGLFYCTLLYYNSRRLSWTSLIHKHTVVAQVVFCVNPIVTLKRLSFAIIYSLCVGEMKLIWNLLMVHHSTQTSEHGFLLLLGEWFQISLSAILVCSTFVLLSSIASCVYLQTSNHFLFGKTNIVFVSVCHMLVLANDVSA